MYLEFKPNGFVVSLSESGQKYLCEKFPLNHKRFEAVEEKGLPELCVRKFTPHLLRVCPTVCAKIYGYKAMVSTRYSQKAQRLKTTLVW